MRAYGLPRNLDVAWPDVADIHFYGLKTSIGGKDYFRSKASKARTRRFWKRKARAAARRAIRSDNGLD